MLSPVVATVQASGLHTLAAHSVPCFATLSSILPYFNQKRADKPSSMPTTMHVQFLQQYRHGSTSLSGCAALAAASRHFRHAPCSFPAASVNSVLQASRQSPATAAYHTRTPGAAAATAANCVPAGGPAVAALRPNRGKQHPLTLQANFCRDIPLEALTADKRHHVRTRAVYLTQQAIREAIWAKTPIHSSTKLLVVKGGTLQAGYQDHTSSLRLDRSGGGVYVIWATPPGSPERTAIYLGKAKCFQKRIQDYMFLNQGCFALDDEGYKHKACLELQRKQFDFEIECFPTGHVPPGYVEAQMLWHYDFALNDRLNGSTEPVFAKLGDSRYVECVPARDCNSKLNLPLGQQEQQFRVHQDWRPAMSRQFAVAATSSPISGVVFTCTAQEQAAAQQAALDLRKPQSTGHQVAAEVARLRPNMQAARDLYLVVMQSLTLRQLLKMTGCKADTRLHACQEALWEQLYHAVGQKLHSAVGKSCRSQAGSNITLTEDDVDKMVKEFERLCEACIIGTKPEAATPMPQSDSPQLQSTVEAMSAFVAATAADMARPTTEQVKKLARQLGWVNARRRISTSHVRSLRERLVKVYQQVPVKHNLAAAVA